MKTTITSCSLFLVLLSFIVYSDYRFDNLCNNIDKQCSDIIEHIEDNNFSQAYTESIDIINQLDNSNLIASVYINHNDYDVLNIEALRLSTYLYSEDKTNSLTTASLLKKYTKDINDLNSVHIKNIF